MKSYGWAVFGNRDRPWLYAVTFLRRQAIQMAEKQSGEPWERLRKKGWTVRRVVVQEDEE